MVVPNVSGVNGGGIEIPALIELLTQNEYNNKNKVVESKIHCVKSQILRSKT